MRGTTVIAATALLLLAMQGGTVRAQTVESVLESMPIDSPMKGMMPTEVPPEIVRFSGRSLGLWMEAMKRPDMQTRQMAMIEIMRAHQQGMKDLGERVGPTLMQMLEVGDLHPAVRLTAAQTLVQIDLREASALLLHRNAIDGTDMVLVTDPALARWGYAPAAEVWLARLTGRESARSVRLSAVESLGALGDDRAAEPLARELEDHSNDDSMRLVMARALSRIGGREREEVAERMLHAAGESIDRLIAVELLSTCDSEDSARLLARIVQGDDPEAAHLALRRMGERDPSLLLPYVERLAANQDASLRALAGKAMFAAKDELSIGRLAQLLGDSSDNVRQQVRDLMYLAASDPALAEVTRTSLMAQLESDRPRAIAESTLLLGRLKHHSASARIAGLLRHRDQVVRICAVAGLRYMEDTSSAPALEDHAWNLAKYLATPRADRDAENPGMNLSQAEFELEQIFQTFGVLRSESATPLLVQYVPKGVTYLSPTLRAAAVWALGSIYENRPEPAIVNLLVDRVQDVGMRSSEQQPVREMAAVSLGLMNARDQIELLKQAGIANDYDSDIHRACKWAIARMGGEPLEEPEMRFREYDGSFLEPYDR